MQTEKVEFKYPLSSLVGWVIRKKDGSTVRFSVEQLPTSLVKYPKAPAAAYPYVAAKSLSTYCNHDPKLLLETPKYQLYIADDTGMKKNLYNKDYSLIIDCGNIITYAQKNPTASKKLIESSSKRLASELMDFAIKGKGLENIRPYLQIDWLDRQAPELVPEFWPELAKRLQGKVIVNCQGGHGRSGTAAVCLMMVETEYDALDAITHLRAVHCPRAIESKIQHEYIDEVAEFLGKTPNAKEADGIKNFRDRFMSLTSPTAKLWQAKLEAIANAEKP